MRSEPNPPRSLTVLRLIAVFKFFKAAFVIATGFGLLSFFNPAVTGALYRLLGELPYQFEQELFRDALNFLSSLSPVRIRTFAIATFAYSSLFLVEGVGLWRGLHWAEVLTIVATSSLIPIEVYEIWRHASVNRVIVLIVNALILGYLIWRMRRERAALARTRDQG